MFGDICIERIFKIFNTARMRKKEFCPNAFKYYDTYIILEKKLLIAAQK